MTAQAERASDRQGSAPSGSGFTIFGVRAEAEPIAAGLHIVATPIGNLSDISLRALGTLAAADTVVAEDTRVTKTLLAHYGIGTPLTAYHEHNAHLVRPQLLARLKAGARLALVSDAGTPLVSDPGFRLVGDAVAQGIAVTAVPGASAVLAALVVAGLPTDRFFFEGFLPTKPGPRRARLAEIATIPGTLVLFEAPQRVAATLADCVDILGGQRIAAVARELTKYFETVRRGSLTELAERFAGDAPPKGEIVLLIGPPDENDAAVTEDTLDARIVRALETHSIKDAASIISGETGVPRRRVYARALQLAGDRPK
jgi:16S rRNA (cytidine1402-2'-O)-methyltransferase